MLSESIHAYLYQEYADDDNLSALIQSFNGLADDYASFFATIGLPIYTNPNVSGELLDWVIQGIYGLTRPSLSTTNATLSGEINTFPINGLEFNGFVSSTQSSAIIVDDDLFRRILTWHFFKGDGHVFSIRWLKRRIIRFLAGLNGTDAGANDTSQISVVVDDGVYSIRIMPGVVTSGKISGSKVVTGKIPALYGMMGFNDTVYDCNASVFTTGQSMADATALQTGISSGVLELPFQYKFSVTI